ncbi:MAG: LysM peptidoglycan-binding domain-containing protein [Balneolaceae bacterium]|nr:LysM peptidoglycan-binding domain-containing protein [Balneolaceae bacterium]
MQKTLPKALFLALLFISSTAFAQDRDKTDDIELREVRISSKLLPYNNPFLPTPDQYAPDQGFDTKPLDEFQKEVIHRIADIYSTHVNILNAQLENDPLSTEKHINKALGSLQSLLDEYPEVQSDRRFSEVYRSVMTEYREFYGIKDPSEQVEGEIFNIHKELFSEEDDWVVEGYVLPENVKMSSFEVPLLQNRQVNRHLMYYTLKRPEVMERWLERSEVYFPMMKRIFREEGVPQELIHLSLIESGLNPTARSWAAAVGMWQFIRATGSMYGLEVNWWMDERRDPEKATRAAARHLKDLYNIWGDWHLAMANYNISPRGLKRAIRAAGEEDYWAAYPYLPRETRGYVPGFIAATMIATNPEEFGFQKRYNMEPYQYEVFEVEPLMPLDELAKAAGITTEELKDYNPELLRWATPPGGRYPLKLPIGKREIFAENYDDIPREKRSQNITMHTVQRGETLGRIARKYGTSVRALYETNENLSHIIYPGQRLVVPLAPGTSENIAASRPTHQPRGQTSTRRSKASAPANSTKLTYRVKKGDTVGHIAEWYDVRSWQIRAWNGISNFIRPGQRLTIYVPDSKQAYYSQVDGMSFAQKQEIESEQRSGKNITQSYLASTDGSGVITYTVRRGDTLIEIANTFGVSVQDIKQTNNISGSRINAGQTLRINKSK